MDYQAKAKAAYSQLDKLSGGIVTIMVSSFQSFGERRAAEAAASLAYYALFSIFPLLIFLVSFASSFLEDEAVQKIIFDFVQNTLPAYFRDLVEGNIERALASRGSVQIVGTIGLLWAASAVFTVLTHNLDRAWQIPRGRNFLLGRLVGLGIIGAITTGMIILWGTSTMLVTILPWFEIPMWDGSSVQLFDTYTWTVFSNFIPWILLFITFVNLYRWVPNTTVLWREAAWGAIVAVVGWEIAQRGFGWYLSSGLARYQLVYGSLGAVIAFMLFLYVSALVVLYGAYLSASIAHNTRLKQE